MRFLYFPPSFSSTFHSPACLHKCTRKSKSYMYSRAVTFTRRIFGLGFPTTTKTTKTRFLSATPSQYSHSRLHHHHQINRAITNQARRRFLSSANTAANMSSTAETAATDPCPKKAAEEGSAAAAAAAATEPALPPLSDYEFKQYNRLAEHMDYFVSHFFPVMSCRLASPRLASHFS